MRLGSYIFLVIVYSALAPTTMGAEPVYDRDPAYYVSLTQLITDPERYVGRKVEVTGYYLKGNNPALFLNHLSADAHDTASAIGVIDQSPQWELSDACNKKYAVLTGRFIYHRAKYTLIEIERARDAKSLETCWENKG